MAEASKYYTTHYPSDVSDAEWEFCAPYLTLMDPEAPQRLPARDLQVATREDWVRISGTRRLRVEG